MLSFVFHYNFSILDYSFSVLTTVCYLVVFPVFFFFSFSFFSCFYFSFVLVCFSLFWFDDQRLMIQTWLKLNRVFGKIYILFEFHA